MRCGVGFRPHATSSFRRGFFPLMRSPNEEKAKKIADGFIKKSIIDL
uniref:Uncharacterized protein n=1 Tax=Heterorhabditis bacteriophora TaxID=37862 RepID=A0A1I7WV70_HETBA